MSDASGSQKLVRLGRIGQYQENQIDSGIPGFTQTGQAVGLLPEGIYQVDWNTFYQHFGGNDHRREILDKLLLLVKALGAAGCFNLFIGGSLVSNKKHPNGFDAIWWHGMLDVLWLPRTPSADALDGAMQFYDATEPDLLCLLHTTQRQRFERWGGHVWLKGEVTSRRDANLGFPEGIEAFELLRKNRRINPTKPPRVGIVRLIPALLVSQSHTSKE